jgi:hypothetical protein
VDNPPVVNVANAGRNIPVKFSVGGNHGLSILVPGYPQVQLVQCDAGPTDPIETYIPDSGLTYDPQSQQCNYVWKTEKSWAGKCGTLTGRGARRVLRPASSDSQSGLTACHETEQV